MLDFGQLWRSGPASARDLVDLGSGAGLPGLVLAIMGAAGGPPGRERSAQGARSCAKPHALRGRRSRSTPAGVKRCPGSLRTSSPPARWLRCRKLLALAARYLHAGHHLPVPQGAECRERIDRSRADTGHMTADLRAEPERPRRAESCIAAEVRPCLNRLDLRPVAGTRILPSPTRRAASARPRRRSIWRPRWPRSASACCSSTSIRKAMPAPASALAARRAAVDHLRCPDRRGRARRSACSTTAGAPGLILVPADGRPLRSRGRAGRRCRAATSACATRCAGLTEQLRSIS